MVGNGHRGREQNTKKTTNKPRTLWGVVKNNNIFISLVNFLFFSFEMRQWSMTKKSRKKNVLHGEREKEIKNRALFSDEMYIDKNDGLAQATTHTK